MPINIKLLSLLDGIVSLQKNNCLSFAVDCNCNAIKVSQYINILAFTFKECICRVFL